jgi:ribosomal protein S20
MSDYPTPETQSELRQYMKHFGNTREEQIEKNQAAIEMLRAWRQEKLSGEELEKAREAFELVKKIIDENRSRKLFSEE